MHVVGPSLCGMALLLFSPRQTGSQRFYKVYGARESEAYARCESHFLGEAEASLDAAADSAVEELGLRYFVERVLESGVGQAVSRELPRGVLRRWISVDECGVWDPIASHHRRRWPNMAPLL